jgi:hypothetical protein
MWNRCDQGLPYSCLPILRKPGWLPVESHAICWDAVMSVACKAANRRVLSRTEPAWKMQKVW